MVEMEVVHLWGSDDSNENEDLMCLKCGVHIHKTPQNHYATWKIELWEKPESHRCNCLDPLAKILEVHES